MSNIKIELSQEQNDVIERLKKNKKIVFLTGRAGTGKTTIISNLVKQIQGNYIVLAPTGVAALNINGLTIHRFFKFDINLTDDRFDALDKSDDKYRFLDYLIVDEISMVRSDMLDYIDKFLKIAKNNSKPFGGIPVLLVGDLYQLPPIVKNEEKEYFRDKYDSEYFFSANVLKEAPYEIIELVNIYRQKDHEFIGILNAIRHNYIEQKHLELLNTRFLPDFVEELTEFYIILCSQRRSATEINFQKLNAIQEKEENFLATTKGKIKPEDYPTDFELKLKNGAQVMLIMNDRNRRWYNGSIGKIIGFEYLREDENDETSDFNLQNSRLIINVRLENGTVVSVEQETWDIEEPSYNKEKKKLEYKSIGTFTQFPLVLSWATTIHKSQGKTFSKVILDISHGLFASGQLYVGLSRCTSLEGLVLWQPVWEKHIKVDWKVSKFFTEHYTKIAEKLLSYEAKERIVKACIQHRLSIEIKYLNKQNILSHRTITPKLYHYKELRGYYFWALLAWDSNRMEDRTFQISRILNIINLDDILKIIEPIPIHKPIEVKEDISNLKIIEPIPIHKPTEVKEDTSTLEIIVVEQKHLEHKPEVVETFDVEKTVVLKEPEKIVLVFERKHQEPLIIELDKESEVLNLTNQNIFRIPREIGQLTNLKDLNFALNTIEYIPEEMYKLTNLVSLKLSGNKYLDSCKGNISHFLYYAKNLTHLYLGSLYSLELLKTIEAYTSMESPVKLEVLDLSRNKLYAVPNYLYLLQNLKELILKHNQFESFPHKIEMLTKLEILDLSDNKIMNLPTEIRQLNNLKELNLSRNQLTNLPSEIGLLQNLTSLNLSNNQLTNLPSEIGLLQNLTSLNLSNNQLTNLPCEIGSLQNLTSLNLSGNLLTNLPSEFKQLTNLEKFYASNNQFSNFPMIIINLINLTSLYMSGNKLEIVPNNIELLENLTDLRLNGNKLKMLPTEVGSLKQLIVLDISNNEIDRFPTEITKLSTLIILNLSNNKLVELPPNIGNLINLKVLDLGKNQIKEIPIEIGKLINLGSLSSRELLEQLGRSSFSNGFKLNENNLTILPKQIENLINLKTLNLGLNQFSNDEKLKIKKLLPNCEIQFN
jgi:ATP-dependent DNA helicase PIF1